MSCDKKVSPKSSDEREIKFNLVQKNLIYIYADGSI